MSRRPLILVIALAVGDYFLWSWSLNGNHDVIALIAGLTLPPLAIAALWLLALTAARVLGGLTRRPGATAPPQRRSARDEAAAAEQAPRKLAA